jgi:Tol biopolymer transport system component
MKKCQRNRGLRGLGLAILIALAGASCGGSTPTDPVAGTIAFVRLNRGGDAVYLMDADGGGRRRLTPIGTHESISDVAWSPDGRKIAYSSSLPSNNDDYYFHIFVINVDGSGRRRLTKTDADDWGPVWAPNGRKIAFDRNGDGPNWVHVVSADGRGLRQLTGELNWSNFSWSPSWSPNGQRIAYDALDGIRTMNPDGSAKLRLASGVNGSSPSWSPDGRRIAFASDDELRVMNADGAHGRTLVRSPRTGIESIAWSPDGRKIVFASGEGDWEIYVVNADGSGLRNLTDNSRVWDRDPSWSPDGRAIAFTSDRDGSDEIYVVNADGGGLRNLSGSKAGDLYPAWSPDG